MLLQVKGLIQIIVMFTNEKKLCTFLSSTKHPFEEHEILCTEYCVQYSKKERIESLCFPEGKQIGNYYK